MQGVATIHPAADFVSQFLAGIIEWFVPKADRDEGDEATIRVRRFTDPIASASNEAELDEAFSTAAQRLPEFMSEIAPFVPIQLPQSFAAIEKLPWLVEHVMGDLDAGTGPHEFLALLLLHMRVFERIMQKAPLHLVERAVEMRPEDILVVQRDPRGVPLFEAVMALFAFTSIHERMGRTDTWRRTRILTRVLGGLRASVNQLPQEHSCAWIGWYAKGLRELGLWIRDAAPTRAIDELLQGNPPNRSALESLRARFETARTHVYVGDVQESFEQVLGGEHAFRRLDEMFAAGELYERGQLSIAELSRCWSLSVPDMIVQLDAMKIVRSPEALRLSEDDRRVRLAKLRADRLVRGGEPAPDPDAVNRSVIASQRIEGIDARGHLREMPVRERS